jgi:hypothetical protein
MRRRTQLYLEEDQYRWLKREAGPRGSIASVVRGLIDRARSGRSKIEDDAFFRYLFDEPAPEGVPRGADSIDEDVYGG